MLKRIFDYTLALAVMFIFLPLWAMITWAIWLQDQGQIFYIQERVGYKGAIFKGIKFRSMVKDAEKDVGPIQAKDNDPRITQMGRLLRKTAMDELPQLLNILKGDMSFVGPRALRPTEIELNGNSKSQTIFQIPRFQMRSAVRPGLTGVAQIFASRHLPIEEKFKYDLWYIKNRSLWLDIILILKSVAISLKRKWDTGKGLEKSLNIVEASFQGYRLFLINILILMFLLFSLEIISSLIIRNIPSEKLLDFPTFQISIWKSTFLERNLPVPEKGWREGFLGERVSPIKITPYLIWMESAAKFDGLVEVTQDGFQIVGDPKTAKFKILIIGGSVAFGSYASNIKNTYFSQVNDYLISRGIPCVTYVLASGAWQSEQEIIALLIYGLKINPDIVIFIDGLNDLVLGREHVLSVLRDNFTVKNFWLLSLESLKRNFRHMRYYLNRFTRHSNIVKLIRFHIRHQGGLATKDSPRETHNNDNEFQTLLNTRTETYLFNMKLAKVLAEYYQFKVIYILQPFIGFKYKLSPLEEGALLIYSKSFNLNLYSYMQAYEKMKEGLAGYSDGKSAYFFDCANALSKEEKTTFCDFVHFSDIGHKLFADCYKEKLLYVIKGIQDK